VRDERLSRLHEVHARAIRRAAPVVWRRARIGRLIPDDLLVPCSGGRKKQPRAALQFLLTQQDVGALWMSALLP
jgi:hypothetical protein